MPYRTLNSYLRQRFGCKVYKLGLDGGMTCPNRDGTCGTGGCIFCDGAGAFAAKNTDSVFTQLSQAKKLVASKAPNAKYIAYFQAFTNTYASVSVLEPLFTQAMEPDEIVAVSIATRPDCLPPAVLDLLSRLNKRKPVWVELGLQTIHPQNAPFSYVHSTQIPLSYLFKLAICRTKGKTAETIRRFSHYIFSYITEEHS